MTRPFCSIVVTAVYRFGFYRLQSFGLLTCIVSALVSLAPAATVNTVGAEDVIGFPVFWLFKSS